MNAKQSNFDAIVIGGGPGGSTAATLIAMAGHNVLLIEKDKLPRYQIGESLLPATVHGICKMLGVFEEVENAGFMRKSGGTFQWGNDPEPWTFAFNSASALAGAEYAYQVTRAEFDYILYNNARRKGVIVNESCSVKELLKEDGRIVGVRYADKNGKEHIVHSHYVVDASGNQSQYHKYAGERVYSKFFQNVALFGYFENGKRLPPPNQGNIFCSAFSQGWFWYIPLNDKLTSVGAVIAKEHANKIKDGKEEALNEYISQCPMIKDYLSKATRVTEGQYGEIRIRKDYSYINSKFWAPGLVLVGDSACFIDPVFSSGVHLATYSGLLAARSINSCLKDMVNETAAFEEFEKRYRREYNLFYDFLLAFYDMHQDADSYYWSARKVLNTEEQANQAFVKLVGGAGSAGDDFFKRYQGFGAAIETVTKSIGNKDKVSESEFQKALKDLRSEDRSVEARNILIHANGKDGNQPREKAIFEGGLIPSNDGLHWQIEQIQ